MRFLKWLTSSIEEDRFLRVLVRVLLLLGLVWFLKSTDVVWRGIFDKILGIFTPFLLGFLIAYLIRPIIHKGEEKKISRKIIIPVLYVGGILLIGWFLLSLIPLIVSRLSSFVSSISSGLTASYQSLLEWTDNNVPNALGDFVKSLVASLDATKTLIPSNLNVNVSGIVSSFLNNLTTTIFTIVISIYFAMDWEKITKVIRSFLGRMHKDANDYLNAVDTIIGSYVRSLMTLIAITFVEYLILYSIIGHPNALVLATLTAIGLLIPYIGQTIANIVAIIASLTLPTGKLIIVVVMIFVMMFVDDYFIAPMVHAKNTKMSPLWALFSVYAGGSLFGAVGILVAIPVFLTIRTIIEVYQKKHPDVKNPKENEPFLEK